MEEIFLLYLDFMFCSIYDCVTSLLFISPDLILIGSFPVLCHILCGFDIGLPVFLDTAMIFSQAGLFTSLMPINILMEFHYSLPFLFRLWLFHKLFNWFEFVFLYYFLYPIYKCMIFFVTHCKLAHKDLIFNCSVVSYYIEQITLEDLCTMYIIFCCVLPVIENIGFY